MSEVGTESRIKGSTERCIYVSNAPAVLISTKQKRARTKVSRVGDRNGHR